MKGKPFAPKPSIQAPPETPTPIAPASPASVTSLWGLFLRNHPQELIFLSTLLLALIARMTSFSLAYAVDDYSFLSDDNALTATQPLMLSQGRFGMVLLIQALKWLGLNVAADYVLGTVLMTLALTWLAYNSVKLA